MKDSSQLNTDVNPISRYDIIIIGLLIGIGVLVRGLNLNERGLEYDEIWTIRSYLKDGAVVTLNNLKVPNNHPLHTLAIKYCVELLGHSNWVYRLPAFVAGNTIPLLAGWIAWKLMKDKFALYFTLIFSLFLPSLIYYSLVARGYSMQTMFLLIYCLSLIYYVEWYQQRHNSRDLAIPIFISFIAPVLATFTLSTSVLFLFVIGVFFVLCLLRLEREGGTAWTAVPAKLFKNHIPIILSQFLAAFFLFLYLMKNYDAIKEAQAFGQDVATLSQFGRFVYSTINKLTLWPLAIIPLGLAFRKKYRLLTGCGYSIILFPFAAAIVTKAGFPRNYLAVVLIVNVLLGVFISLGLRKASMTYRYLSVCVFSVFLLWFSLVNLKDWKPPEWAKVALVTQKRFPHPAMISYPGTSGLVISHYLKNIYVDTLERIPAQETDFIQIGSKGFLSAVNLSNGNRKEISLPPFLRETESTVVFGQECSIYRLIKVHSDDDLGDDIVVAAIQPGPVRNTEGIYDKFSSLHMKWYTINAWLSRPVIDKNHETVLGMVLVSSNCTLPSKALVDTTQKSKGRIRFFKLTPVKKVPGDR